MSNQTSFSRDIYEDEVLVRFLYITDFKKKNIDKGVSDKDVYLDTRGPVSLQRANFCNEICCKRFAKQNPRGYVGFLVFDKQSFNEVFLDHRSNRPDFEVEIKGTPLDELGNYISGEDNLISSDKGNPFHADLVYINPACIQEESPNTAMRAFSRKLYKVSYQIIDENRETDKVNYSFTE